MADIDEKRLMELLSAQKTCRQAFAEVVRQYGEQLYWLIRRMVLAHEDADDVLQNTFLKAWANLGEFQGRSKLSTWLHKIAINESLDFLRRQKLTANIYADDEPSVSQKLLADNYFDGNEAEAMLQEAISELPEVQRQVFTLRYYEEMKYSEMSHILGTSEGALKASYHIAVRKIHEYLSKHD